MQGLEPYQASGATFTLEEQDHQILNALRKLKRGSERPGMGVPETLKRIRDVQPGDTFSCHCKVSRTLPSDQPSCRVHPALQLHHDITIWELPVWSHCQLKHVCCGEGTASSQSLFSLVWVISG